MEICGVWPETFSKINLELSLLNKLLDSFDSLIDQVKTREPTKVELIALAGILHSFYSGFENVFKRISQDIDGGLKKSDSWHADLLENMISKTPKRSAVISENLKERLQLYLGFRHVFRSMYSYDLNWTKMQDLVFESKEILKLVETEMKMFIQKNQ
jgi:hypothetical protein